MISGYLDKSCRPATTVLKVEIIDVSPKWIFGSFLLAKELWELSRQFPLSGQLCCLSVISGIR